MSVLVFRSGGLRSEVDRLEGELRSVCVGVDPDDIALGEVCEIWSAFDALERLAAGAKCRLARRVEESRAWQRSGERSAAEWMARRAGTTTGRARAALEASKALVCLADTDAALATGELSNQEAEALCGAAGADPSAEEALLRTARHRDLADLREACARTRARAEDDAERTERLRRQRFLRTWSGPDGSWNLAARHTPEVGAEIEAALAPLREAAFHQGRRSGTPEANEAYAADALAAMARRSVGAEDEDTADETTPASQRRSRRPDTKVIALIDHQALLRGWAAADETCEIAGVGPVPVATVRSLLGDAFGAAIVTDGVDVYTVAHLGRSVSAHQRSALEARGYRCEVPGCGATRALEIDHMADWSLTRRTRLAELCWLCRVHHADKTHRGWRIEGPPGARRWIAPAPSPPGPSPPRAAEGAARRLFDDPPGG